MTALALIMLVVAPISIHAAGFSSADGGSRAAMFLQLGAGARAAAMGEAYSAVVDEASALYWNPAAMTRVKRRSATLMHSSYLANSYFDYGAFVQNLGSGGALGASVQYFSSGDIAQTNTAGTDEGTFNPYDYALSVGYARPVGGFAVGLSAKYIESKIIGSAKTAAADLGILSPSYFDGRLTFAVTASNVGGKIRFSERREGLTMTARIGSALKIGDQLVLALDLASSRDDRLYGAIGTEYRLLRGDAWNIAGRAGFNTHAIGDVDGLRGLTMGVGFGHGRHWLDYGFIPFGAIGEAHQVSVTLNF